MRWVLDRAIDGKPALSRRLVLLCCALAFASCATSRLKGHVTGNSYDAPDGSFTVPIPNHASRPTVTDMKDEAAGSVNFIVPYGELFRIDYMAINKHPLARAAEHSSDEQIVDTVLINMLNFTASSIQGLEEMSLIEKRTSADLQAPVSFAAFSLRVNAPAMRGTYLRGYLVFKHASTVFVLHYQPPGQKMSADDFLKLMSAFGKSIAFADGANPVHATGK